MIGRTSSLLDEMAAHSPLFDEAKPGANSAEITDKLPITKKSGKGSGSGKARSAQSGANTAPAADAGTSTSGGNGSEPGEKGKLSGDDETDAFLDGVRSSDGYDTGQFRVADILEQELAELQAERKRARSGRTRSASTNGA